MTDGHSEEASSCSCKLGAVADEFGLEGVDEALTAEWEATDGKSVRDLTTWFNKQLLRSAFRAAGRLPIDGEIDNVHRVFTNETVDSVERARARDQLEQDGIPISDVEDAMVAHQTLYRHLRNCLETNQTTSTKTDQERVDDWRSRIRALKNRTTTVTTRGIEQLQNTDTVTIGSFDVVLELTVSCNDCGAFYTLEEFLDERACKCDTITTESR